MIYERRQVAHDPSSPICCAHSVLVAVGRATLADTKVRQDGFVFSPAIDGSTMTRPELATQHCGRVARQG